MLSVMNGRTLGVLGSAIALSCLSGCSLRHSQAAGQLSQDSENAVGTLEVRANGEGFVRDLVLL